MSLVQHSSKSCEWYTPADIISRAHQVLGGIDLDPASSAEANAVVGAQTYYTQEHDGLKCDWFGSIWLNPPGGKVAGKSLPLLFWQRLMEFRTDRFFDHAIVMCFSIEQLQTTQGREYPSMLQFPLCIPKKRISFVQGDGQPAGSPAHANAIVYVPGRRNHSGQFAEAFKDMGEIVGVGQPTEDDLWGFTRAHLALAKPNRLAFRVMFNSAGLIDAEFEKWAEGRFFQ